MSDLDEPALPQLDRFLGRAMHLAEMVLYALVAVLLVAGAALVLVDAAIGLVDHADDARHAVEDMLDTLLVVFILVELLSAVRTTLRERALVAEPFLLVGIIASIKEIVVVGAFAEDSAEVGDTVLQIGVLAGVVLALSVASFLVRRKEREPEE